MAGTIEFLTFTAAVLFLTAIRIRLAAIKAEKRQRPGIPPLRPDHLLPVYTVLVPLYREASVLPQLVAHLAALDYPKAKLDIKLLIEADDRETLDAAAALGLDAPFEIVRCPPGRPRTKPRALNIGLRFARGEFVVVFDAEDQPEPEQLRRAASMFHHGPAHLACVQGALAIHNAGDGWLSRMFALEYAMLFDVVLPGFARLGLPLPLGGTSNHFRTRALERTLGWDAWNVTEDADLGLRFAEEGLSVGVLPATTWEEAPFQLRAWFMQRRRWMKGWMQTALVHSRIGAPRIARLGARGCAALLAHTWATVLAALGLPFFLSVVVWKMAKGELLVPGDATSVVTDMMMVTVLAAGALSLVEPIRRAAPRRRLALRPSDAVLFLPYLALISAASWAALWELAVAPSRWNKTPHGLSRGRPVNPGAPASPPGSG